MLFRQRLRCAGAVHRRRHQVHAGDDQPSRAGDRDGVERRARDVGEPLSEELAVEAQRLALRLAQELDVVGGLAVELFETDGPGGIGSLMVNELAMRPHNSGHWTIEGARTSQFEQHLRAVLDYPLGATQLTAPVVVMANVLGGESDEGFDERLHLINTVIKPGFATARAVSGAVVPAPELARRTIEKQRADEATAKIVRDNPIEVAEMMPAAAPVKKASTAARKSGK
mgnify:CR=1 FL=1